MAKAKTLTHYVELVDDTKAKISDAFILKAFAWLQANYSTPFSIGKATNYGLLVAHTAKKATHRDARLICKQFLALMGITGEKNYSENAIWHSVRDRTARVRKGKANSRYDSDANINFGGARLRCTNDKHGYTRSKCERECEQGLYFEGEFLADTLKGAKGKANVAKRTTAKRKTEKGSSTPKQAIKAENVTTGGTAPTTNPDDVTVTAPSKL